MHPPFQQFVKSSTFLLRDPTRRQPTSRGLRAVTLSDNVMWESMYPRYVRLTATNGGLSLNDSKPPSDEILTFLDRVEALIRRVLVGLFRFLGDKLLPWLHDTLIRWGRIGWRLTRISFFLACWASLVFAPVWFLSSLHWSLGLMGTAWLLVGLSGSYWAFRHYRHVGRKTTSGTVVLSPAEAPPPILSLPSIAVEGKGESSLEPITSTSAVAPQEAGVSPRD